MLPINFKQFKAYKKNNDILYLEMKDSGMVKAFIKTINKEDEVVLIKTNNDSKQTKKDLEIFTKMLEADNKVTILVEDL